MYGGAGAADLLAAAAAWNGIAVEVSTAASSVGSVITRLSTEHWMGPASLSMAAAVQPYLVWLTCTAESSALAAAQAMASAAAFETAFALTVPPAEVVANRALLAELTATNILGQNVSAIAATEARYGEMWAQDASAMYGYAAASAVAARLNPLTRPSHITNPAGLAHQAAAVGQAGASASARQVGLSHLISDVADAVLSFASPVMSAADTGLEAVRQFLNLDVPLFVESAFHGLGGVADFATAAIGNMTLLADAMGTVGGAAPGGGAAAAVAHAVAPAGVGGTALTADLGNASVVGRQQCWCRLRTTVRSQADCYAQARPLLIWRHRDKRTRPTSAPPRPHCANPPAARVSFRCCGERSGATLKRIVLRLPVPA
ncbi:PPE family protein PPE44 [Mycobacterium tuberculosis KT-0051]|nr:PPE family protein PPE44 [Mycobacterium tuberculosis KT-0051]